MTRKMVLRAWRDADSKSVEQKQVVARKKIKFKNENKKEEGKMEKQKGGAKYEI